MLNPLYSRNFLAIEDFSRPELELILKVATHFKRHPPSALLCRQVVASCFFEPSTRTRLSFESAAKRLGGSIIGFSDGSHSSSQQKGESLTDTIQVISHYADAIVLRHPQVNAPALAATASRGIPIINAGDGTHQHPTQTLLDLFTIQETQQHLDALNIAMVGDLKYGRTVHSLTLALAKFKGNQLFFVAPDALSMPHTILQQLEQQGVVYSVHRQLQEVIQQVDILYMTRLQKERFQATEYDGADMPLTLRIANLQGVRSNLKILHPLPRLAEIHPEIDNTPHAYYFQQAGNGLHARQALLALLLRPEISLQWLAEQRFLDDGHRD